MTAEDQTTILRLLAERRDDLAGERTRILNRLHGLLHDLVPGGAPTDLTAAKAAAVLRRLRRVTRPTPAADNWPASCSATCGASTPASKPTRPSSKRRWPPPAAP